MFPTTHLPVSMPTPTLIGTKRCPFSFGLLFALPVERVHATEHFKRGFARIVFVKFIVQWRVPERHNGVAHIFVDRAFVVDDCVRQRRQEAVHQRGETLRVILVKFCISW